MNVLDKRLWQARSVDDFLFRLHFNEKDISVRRNALREIAHLTGQAFITPDPKRIWGVDISHWDGLVNLQVTKEYGASFVIIKAMDGTILTKYYKENTAQAIAVGLLHAPYAWLYPDKCVSCEAQARAYHNLIKDVPVSLPPVLDFEWTHFNGQQANPNYTDLRKWLAAFIRLSGVKPILYTAAGYVSLFGAVPADILDMLAGEWVASYGGTVPSMPKGIAKWDVWQFSANGDALKLCPGNQGKRELDLNYMTDEFYQRYGVAQPPPVEPGETMKGKVIKLTNIRQSNTQFSADMGDLLAGDLVEWTEEGTGSDGLVWIKLISATHNGAPVRCSDGNTVTGRYCWAANVEEVNAPPSPVTLKHTIEVYSDGSIKVDGNVIP
jgi:lysozyme